MSNESIDAILKSFNGLSLDALDSVKLQNRVDSKFVFKEGDLNNILEEASKFYNALDLEGIRSNTYHSLYFDTPDDHFFISHHNGKLNRFKVRYRQYMNSGLCFLEVKFKNNKGRTIKSRMRVPEIPKDLIDEDKAFVDERIGASYDLRPSMWNSFERITLAHKEIPERLTIDHGLVFSLKKKEIKLSNICIAELKQEKLDYSSVFMKIMRAHGSHPSSMSKYCIGSLLLRPELKHNRFKEKLLRLNKLSNGIIPAYV